MLTMRPSPRSRRSGPTARIPRNGPRRFVASTSSHSSGVDLEQVTNVGSGGAVDERREIAGRLRERDGALPGVGITDVEERRNGVAPELGREQRDGVAVDVAEHERPPVGEEPPGDGSADPASGAGDDGDLTEGSSRLAPIAPPRSPSSASR